MLERSRCARVHDEADVGSVNPHPERHRRDDDVGALLEERLLIPAPHAVVEPRVIRQRAQPLALQPLGEGFDFLPR